MLVTWCLMSTLYVVGHGQIALPTYHLEKGQLIQCVTGVLNKYFTEQNELTYVNMGIEDEELLKTIHSTNNFSLFTRKSTYQSILPNQGYLINSKNVTIFTEYFEFLMQDPAWNPYAPFLVVVESLQNNELRVIFDELLKLHVNNVVVMNGTADAHLFTYNPFDNYACGKYYDNIISLGLCSQASDNLYPNKLVTGLKNCTLRASVAHRPPFSINPLKSEDEKTILGSEEYIFKILSEKEQFNVIFNYSYDGNIYSSVDPNMTVSGPMIMLRNNETDVIFGGMMVVLTRAQALTWLNGYHDYNEELRFAVKRAASIPIWKTVYIEFDCTVWFLLLLSLIVYFTIMVLLLRPKDKGYIALELLENLLLHSRGVRCSMSIKCIHIIWVLFAYLINTFYQSSLVSLTTDPSKEYQVSSEEDIFEYNYKPCFSPALRKYLSTEHTKAISHNNAVPLAAPERKECNNTLQALTTVSQNQDMYSIIPHYLYQYYKRRFIDKWGNPTIYYFDKPYTKFLFAFYFYKGFPITPSLQLNALRMRENGLAEKSKRDQYFLRSLKQKFSQKEFVARFTLPWCVYVVGCIVSMVTFLIEYLPKHRLKR